MANEIYAGNPFQINVVASDPDKFPGTPLSYMWTQTAGPAAATFSNVFALQPSITCPVPGSYTFQITVSDSISTSTASLTVSVLPFFISTQSYTAVCPSGTVGASVVRSGTYSSIVSQPDADSKALATAQTAAVAALQCSATPAVWTLRLAQGVKPAETLTYNLFRLDSGIAANPKHATFLRSYTIDNVHWHPGDTLDYTSVVTAFGGEQTFLWQLAYSTTTSGSGGSGQATLSSAMPLTYETLQVDPSYTLIGKAYTKECSVSGSGVSYPVNVVTGVQALQAASTYIDAPNVPQTYLALQHDFSSPPRSKLWIYNWDQRKAAAGATLYDHLRVSWLSSGTLAAPQTETTLYEADFSIATYGANAMDEDLNYLSLDAQVAALPNAGGVLIVRRGVFDPVGQVVNYGPDSVYLRAAGVSGTGTAVVGNLSGNANIPENISGAVTLSSNAMVARVHLAAGAFALRNYNWRSSANANYNYLVVYQLIGSPGAFTGTLVQYAFPMQTPDSPAGFFEIPLPSAANGVSFAVYAATQTGTNIYSLYPDSFPLGTVYGSNFIDVFGVSTTAPYTVTSLAANAIPGLPSAANGVFTVTDNTRQVILERNAPYG
jgi:K319L-like, PKD domain